MLQTSAAGVLALLSEPEPVLRQHALKALLPLVPRFWAEISEHIAAIETLYESDELPKESRDAAALLASKIYYYLGEYDEALSFALGAGSAFEAESRAPGSEEYVETVVSKAIDRYIESRSAEIQMEKIDSRLQDIVEGIFKRCIEDGEHKQALGIALESHRLDVVKHIFSLSSDTELISYVMEAVLDTGFKLSYRDEVLHFLLPLFPPPSSHSSHIYALTRLLVTLSDASLTVSLLTSLIPKEKLLAYQFAFDFVEGGSQEFLEAVRNELPIGTEGVVKEIYDNLRQILSGEESIKLYLDFLKRNNKVDMLILKTTKDSLEARSSVYHTALTLQNAYMHSGTASDLFLRQNLEWLGRASNWSKFSATAALGVIHKGHFEQSMTLLGPYLPGADASASSSVFSEGGSLYALGIINAGMGSTRDVETYLREKLKASNNEVVQHGACLGLGVAGMASQSQDAYDDLKATLYSDSAIASEAAGYAMGLVKLGSASEECAEEMLVYAHETQHEKIIRGLAIGVAFIYYGRQEQSDAIVSKLLAEKDPILRYGGVYTLAIAYAGTSNNDAIRKLLHVAVSDTSDDVRRAAVTALAFLLFKNPSQVPRIVQLLGESYNPHVRCGATLALGIACAGTGLQDAVEILEPMTKDTVDFVRQGAFIALGMILVQQSEASSPSLSSTRSLYTKTVSDKHEDPMARFGAVLGQGLIDAGGRNVTISLQSRAGSRNMSAIVGMVMFCQFWYWYPLAHCACLAFEPTGIIGLNGELKPPKFDFVSNARPSLYAYPPSAKPPTKETVEKVATAVLSTTAKAKAREKTKEKEKVIVDGEAMETDDKHEVKKRDISPISGSMSGLPDTSSSLPISAPGASKRRQTMEPNSETLPNFSRVTPSQLAHIVFPNDGRYQPVRPIAIVPAARSSLPPKAGRLSSSKLAVSVSERYAGGGGIILLTDRRPDELVDLIDFGTEERTIPVEQGSQGQGAAIPIARSGRPGAQLDDSAPEADPPESFEYPFDNDT
ncbi:26S proteasome regulatory complex, non-ATPase subcomplex, Rpn2/Psmd1 subunit [Ramaria rubella]|nr:26S proteasome regulatory complex, non-ATPase subcomplex, Rpn2/Psmd1 subunit [Ramaria rubella]